MLLIGFSRCKARNFIVQVNSRSRSEAAHNTDLEGFRKVVPLGEAEIIREGFDDIDNRIAFGV